MFPFSSLTAVSVISDLPLEVTTCKFRILDGEASPVIKRFLGIRGRHERFLASDPRSYCQMVENFQFNLKIPALLNSHRIGVSDGDKQ